MKALLPGVGATLAAAFLCGAALAAQPAPAEQPGTAPAEPSTGQPAAKGDDKADTAEAEPEEERICRYVKLDMSSRRKTKVCRTTREWVELGNPR